LDISKGLHGINKKIPELNLQRDVLSFSLQIVSLFVCILMAAIWPIFGFDSTIYTASNTILGIPMEPADFGGLHLSTILNFFIICFLVSNYLSSKKIRAFHNVVVSIMTPIVAMMAFEFIWVFLTDVFHSTPVEGPWAITAYGLGFIDLGMLALGVVLIPLSVFYLTFHVTCNKICFSPKVSLNMSLAAATFSAGAILMFSIIFGTPSVLIRNSFGLLFFAFVHATLFDSRRGDFILDFKPRTKQALVAAAAAAVVIAIWVFLPHFEVVKGALWPQTIYAFYEKGVVTRVLYVQNDVIHALNVLSKALTTGAVSLAIIPKIRRVVA